MSWTETLTQVDADAIDAAEPANEATNQARDQFDAARAAAAAIIRSGAVGEDRAHFVVHLTGHANPDHETTTESRDVIQVSVAQVLDPLAEGLAAERVLYDESQDEAPVA